MTLGAPEFTPAFWFSAVHLVPFVCNFRRSRSASRRNVDDRGFGGVKSVELSRHGVINPKSMKRMMRNGRAIHENYRSLPK